MGYIINDVAAATPQKDHIYLFDANVWLVILEGDTYGDNSYRSYISFFDKILNNTVNAKIGLPAILVSEIINRILRDVYFPEFSENFSHLLNNKKSDYKTVYRAHSQYAIDMENACQGIRAYHKHCTFISDNLEGYSFKQIIKNIPSHLDFNDYLYTKMAIEQGIVIVTNDKDFFVEDIHILTNRRELLQGAINANAVIAPR